MSLPPVPPASGSTDPEEPAGAPLAGLRLSLLGAGRVGRSLASWAKQQGAVVLEVAGPRPAPVQLAARELGAVATTAEMLSGRGDLLLIAVPDRELAAAARSLASRRLPAVALHTSGSWGAEALEPLRSSGVAIGTLHPLCSFPHHLPDLPAAEGIFFALDGDPPAVALGRRLASSWHGESAIVAGTDRLLYHLAASLAAGGVTTLLAAAFSLAERLALPAAARDGYVRLAEGAVAQTRRLGDPIAALTGPVGRGDQELVLRQLEALRSLDGELASTAAQLARQTLLEMGRRAPLGAAHRELLAALESACRS